MPTPNLGLVQPGNDTLIGVWDVPMNGNAGIIDSALGGLVSINTNGVSGNVLLQPAQYVNSNLIFTGTPTGAVTYQLPGGVGRFFFVYNSTPTTIWFGSAIAGSALADVPSGYAATVVIDPVNGARLANTVVATAGGAPGQVQFNQGGGLAGAAGITYDPATQNLLLGGALGIAGNLAIGGNVTSSVIVSGGGAATLTRTPTFNAGGTVIDCSLSNVFSLILTASMTAPLSVVNGADGQTINVRMQQDATGSRTVLWPSNFRWSGGAPSLSTTAGLVDLLVATYFAAPATWLANLIKGFPA